MLAISQGLLNQYQDLSLLLITGSPMAHGFGLSRERFDYIKLPCLNRDLNGVYGARNSAFRTEHLIDLRAQMILSAVKSYNPDLLLVDKKPLGVESELAPSMEYLYKKPNCKVVLLLRDILDSPATTCRIWQKHDYFRALEHYFDRILVVGSENVFDVRSEYRFPPKVASMVRFCGYINRFGLNGVDRLNPSKFANKKKMIVVTPGGGEDGFPLIRNYLDGLTKTSRYSDFCSIVVTGPEMPASQQNQVKAAAASRTNVVVEEFNNNLPGLLQKADLVVSMAGYNTLCELLSLNKRAVVVPRVKPGVEQWLRAEQFCRMGLLTAIHPDQLTPSHLVSAINKELVRPRLVASKELNFNGILGVCRETRQLLDETQSSCETVPVIKPNETRKSQSQNRIPAQNLPESLRDFHFARNISVGAR